MTRSYINENAAQLVPGDKLTIQCKLSVFGNTNTAVAEVRNGLKTGHSHELTSSQLGRDLGKLLSAETHSTQPFAITSSSPSSSSSSSVQHTSATLNHSDVTMQVGDEAFPAHKAILSARSQVFASMFDHDMIEQVSLYYRGADSV